MEPEVHIVERYMQLVKKCFTMTNIVLEGGKEIDLLAVNPGEAQEEKRPPDQASLKIAGKSRTFGQIDGIPLLFLPISPKEGLIKGLHPYYISIRHTGGGRKDWSMTR